MKVFLVGGFLGSGKTTAIHQAALCLQQEGKKTGVVTNDQGEQLVDTQFIRQQQIAVSEVTQGCFCCNFQQLRESLLTLQKMEPVDVIFAESVGSCTDLIATVIKPLSQVDKPIESVLSVFADVRLLCSYLLMDKDIFHGNMNYIFEKQLEEADILVVNKTDTLTEKQFRASKKLIEEEYGHKKILYQNSLNKKDIRHWLKTANNFPSQQMRPSLEINYDRYAAGEAEMAWFDGELEITSGDNDAGEIGYQLMSDVNDLLREKKFVIGHLKFLMTSNSDRVKVSFTTIPSTKKVKLKGFKKTNRVTVLINARVKVAPEILERIIVSAIRGIQLGGACNVREKSRKAFQPGYPRPTYRIGN